jgi:hypothetical protein
VRKGVSNSVWDVESCCSSFYYFLQNMIEELPV